jgi:hypothetical protein
VVMPQRGITLEEEMTGLPVVIQHAVPTQIITRTISLQSISGKTTVNKLHAIFVHFSYSLAE